MWILNDYLKNNSEEAAQFFHFDLERVKWLKVFIYLDDVDKYKAPHTYIEGSHINNTKPEELLKKGYKRIKDSEVSKYYKTNKIKSIIGKAGTIIIGDTKCWHKGGNIKKGKRTILQLEFASSLFGENQDAFKVKNPSDAFIKFCKSNPFFSSNINLEHN